jgi:hypothetical protein
MLFLIEQEVVNAKYHVLPYAALGKNGFVNICQILQEKKLLETMSYCRQVMYPLTHVNVLFECIIYNP